MFIFIFALASLILTLLYAIYKLVKASKNRWISRKRLKQNRYTMFVLIIACIISIIILIITLINLLGEKSKTEVIREETIVEENNVEDILASLVFESEVINSDTIIWQYLIGEYLHFDYYVEWCENNQVSKNELRYKYLTEIREDSNLPIVSLDGVQKLIKDFYGTGLLPETDMTLAEVDEKTPSLENRMNTDPNLYKAELWLRMTGYNVDSSIDYIYQAARSGDDVFKTEVNQNVASTKDMLFYSSVSVALYQQVLKHDDEISITKVSFIKYRIGEIDYYLYQKLVYNPSSIAMPIINRDELSEHLLLSAEAYFLSSYDDFLQEGDGEDIHVRQPYHDAYLAMIEYDLITKYGHADENVKNMCLLHARRYIDSPYAKPNLIRSCNDIIEKLNNQ